MIYDTGLITVHLITTRHSLSMMDFDKLMDIPPGLPVLRRFQHKQLDCLTLSFREYGNLQWCLVPPKWPQP